MTNTGRRPAYHWSNLQKALAARGGEVRTERVEVERVELDHDEVRKIQEGVEESIKKLSQKVDEAKPDDMGRLALAVALASDAISRGVQHGDYYWHKGPEPFRWKGQQMDAPEMIEHGTKVLNG